MPGAPAAQVSMVLRLARTGVRGDLRLRLVQPRAIMSAADQLRLGRADIMLAGGTDAPLVYGC